MAVDGGLATCRARRLRPDVFVGDLDSTRRAPAGIPSVIFPAAKDFSDFAGALGELVRLGVDLVVIAGLVGGRLDHEWANVLEAGAMARRFSCVVAPSSRGLVVVTARTVKVATAENALVSVFALHGAARVTLAGTSWTLERRRVSPGSLGLSNRSAGSLRLQVHSGVVALILPRTNRYRIPTLSRKESTSRPTRSR